MTEQDNKINDFLYNLPARYVADRFYDSNLSEIVEKSGLPKDDFLTNEKFQDFVLTKMAARSLHGDIVSDKENDDFIKPMIAKDYRFAEGYLNLLEHAGAGWNKGFMGYVAYAADVATLANSDYDRTNAYILLGRYTNEENVINYLRTEHIENLKEPDRFMELAEKQLDAEIKNMKTIGAAEPFDTYGLDRLSEFAEKFPEYKEKVGLLVKKAKDNNLIKKSRNNSVETEYLIGDIPAAKLEKLRKRIAGAVGLENVKMPFKGLERDLSQMIFEKKSKKQGKNA